MRSELYINQYIRQFQNLKREFWNYEDGCMLTALQTMYHATQDETYVKVMQDFLEQYILEDGTIRWYDEAEYSLDKIPSGRALIFLYQHTGMEKYKLAADRLRAQLDHQPRTDSGSFWHKNIYPYQIWLDGLYMAGPFYLLYEREFHEGKGFADILHQFENTRKFLYSEEYGTYIHVYDEKRIQPWADKKTGKSPNFWSRAIGWYLMALADCCELMPQEETGRSYLVTLWKEAVDGMLRYQDKESGLFFQLTVLRDTGGNYLETSSSAMVAYSLLKGVKLGVFGLEYFEMATRILCALADQKLNIRDGRIHLDGICAGAGLGPANRPQRDGTVRYYLSEAVVSDEQKGVAAFIMAYGQWLQTGGVTRAVEEVKLVEMNDVYQMRHSPNALEKLVVGYGHGHETVEVPMKSLAAVLVPQNMGVTDTEQEVIQKALDHPIGTVPLEEMAVGKKRVVIITSDSTRPMPSWKVIPAVVKRLEDAGVDRSCITIVFALGSHRRQTEEEKIHLVGEDIYRNYRCMDSSEFELVHMGDTKEGTPIDIAEAVANADLKICLGNIEYHFFAGYSGGAKAIMPGVSTVAAIQKNHVKMLHPMAHAGVLEGNPVREDLEEGAQICGVDFLLNVVLDEHKQIIHAVAGDLVKAHRAGCRYLDGVYRCEIREQADIVIVSQGGAPKDLNLYQTQKALANAELAVKQGGIIILVGACPEGPGSQIFEDWMRQAENVDQIMERIQKEFVIGGHKAASFARALKRARILLVSGLDKELVKEMFMEPFDHVQEAYDAAVKEKGQDARVIVMPYGGSTLPVVVEE